MNFNKVNKLFVFLIVWAGAKQSRSPRAEQPTQVRVYQLPMGIDGLAILGSKVWKEKDLCYPRLGWLDHQRPRVIDRPVPELAVQLLET